MLYTLACANDVRFILWFEIKFYFFPKKNLRSTPAWNTYPHAVFNVLVLIARILQKWRQSFLKVTSFVLPKWRTMDTCAWKVSGGSLGTFHLHLAWKNNKKEQVGPMSGHEARHSVVLRKFACQSCLSLFCSTILVKSTPIPYLSYLVRFSTTSVVLITRQQGFLFQRPVLPNDRSTNRKQHVLILFRVHAIHQYNDISE